MRKKGLILGVLLIISLMLLSCSRNDETSIFASKEDKLIVVGRDLTKKLIVNYFDSRTNEELEEKYLSLFDGKFLNKTGMLASIKLHHEKEIKEISRSEVDEVDLESIQSNEDGSLTYKATIRTKYYYVEPQANDKQYETSRKDWSVDMIQDENGEYKILNYDLNIPGLG
ncbi:hypothetical protein G8C92_12170 [Paenibacillus donghaensis]|uniref:hypothetical protein n=1 Tax=Paenibacillus donghaensis TaxID=414771 RepID=UPI0018843238|nr:hypothetical protein [Paenibacillus donghaensis]MBE9914789.1 hypothetical protein [Paenibacillus donghaensis]